MSRGQLIFLQNLHGSSLHCLSGVVCTLHGGFQAYVVMFQTLKGFSPVNPLLAYLGTGGLE